MKYITTFEGSKTFNLLDFYEFDLPYEQQYAKGLEVLKMFAEQLGETIIWL